MPKYQIVYFAGCPLLNRARKALRDAGITHFLELNQDKLPPGHEWKDLSSPSIIVDGKLFVGHRGSALSCTIADWGVVASKLVP